MDEVGIFESIVAALEGGAVGYILYQKKRISKKKAMLLERDKELQAKTDEMQDLKTDLKMANMKVEMLEKNG